MSDVAMQAGHQAALGSRAVLSFAVARMMVKYGNRNWLECCATSTVLHPLIDRRPGAEEWPLRLLGPVAAARFCGCLGAQHPIMRPAATGRSRILSNDGPSRLNRRRQLAPISLFEPQPGQIERQLSRTTATSRSPCSLPPSPT